MILTDSGTNGSLCLSVLNPRQIVTLHSKSSGVGLGHSKTTHSYVSMRCAIGAQHWSAAYLASPRCSIHLVEKTLVMLQTYLLHRPCTKWPETRQAQKKSPLRKPSPNDFSLNWTKIVTVRFLHWHTRPRSTVASSGRTTHQLEAVRNPFQITSRLMHRR